MAETKREKPSLGALVFVVLGAVAFALGVVGIMAGVDGLRGDLLFGTMEATHGASVAALIIGIVLTLGGLLLAIVGYAKFPKKGMGKQALLSICEGAILIALAQVLSMLKLWEMPQGGSITLAMLPICVYAVRWGTGRGLLAGLVFGLLQLMFDGGFAIGWQSVIGDYLVAFTVIGLAGLGHGKSGGIFWGSLVGCLARYAVHWVVGATVWAEYMPDVFCGMNMNSPWFYSIVYNGIYMIPDTVLVLVIVCLLNRPLKKLWNGAEMRPQFGFFFGGGTSIVIGALGIWYGLVTRADAGVSGPAGLIFLIVGAVLAAGGIALLLCGAVRRGRQNRAQA